VQNNFEIVIPKTIDDKSSSRARLNKRKDEEMPKTDIPYDSSPLARPSKTEADGLPRTNGKPNYESNNKPSSKSNNSPPRAQQYNEQIPS
jgi:hypothetical protein